MAYFGTHAFASSTLNVYRGISAPGYPQLWAALFASDPTATGVAGAEVAYDGYERQPFVPTPPAMRAGNLSIQNADAITWPMSNQAASPATHIGILDSRMAGVMLLRGALAVPLQINPLSQPGVTPGDIVYWGRGDFSMEMRRAYLNRFLNVAIPGFEPRLAMYNDNPETGGVELTGLNYERGLITFTAPFVSENGIMTIENSSPMLSPTPLGEWGLFAYNAIMRGQTSEIAHFTRRMKNQDPDPIFIHRNYVASTAQGALTVRLN